MRKKISIYLATLSQEMQEAVTWVQPLAWQLKSQMARDWLRSALKLSVLSCEGEITKMPTFQVYGED